jgi:hypothetical protein
VIGGFNANQLLTGIDYSLVAAHLKVLCGFSDITALSHALVPAREEQLHTDLKPGRHTVEAAYLEAPDTACLILVRLTLDRQTTS